MLANKERITKWVKALRSGDYEQGKGYLCKDSEGSKKFCCLGVACDLYIKEEAPYAEWEEDRAEYNVMGLLESTYVMPTRVMDWLGVESRDPMAFRDGKDEYLSRWNDTSCSFNDIAKMIEEKYLM